MKNAIHKDIGFEVSWLCGIEFCQMGNVLKRAAQKINFDMYIYIYVCISVLKFMNYFVGIGMDASVTPLRHGGLSLVQTTDFFYPLVDDPYMMVN